MSSGLNTVSAVPLMSKSGAEERSSQPWVRSESLGALSTQSSNVFSPMVDAKRLREFEWIRPKLGLFDPLGLEGVVSAPAVIHDAAKVIRVCVRDLSRPIPTRAQPPSNDSARIQIVARPDPVKRRIPHPLGISRCQHRRVGGSGNIDRQYRSALVQYRREQIGGVFFVIVQSSPREQDRQFSRERRFPEMPNDCLALTRLCR